MGVGADAPKRLALDTSAYSWLRAGDARVIDWLSAAESIIVPATVLGELRAGFELGGRTRENLTALAEFLQEPFVSMRGVGADEAARYGHLFAALRMAGTPIPTNDIWIAATAIQSRAHLLTFDTDFQVVPGLKCTVLPVRHG